MAQKERSLSLFDITDHSKMRPICAMYILLVNIFIVFFIHYTKNNNSFEHNHVQQIIPWYMMHASFTTFENILVLVCPISKNSWAFYYLYKRRCLLWLLYNLHIKWMTFDVWVQANSSFYLVRLWHQHTYNWTSALGMMHDDSKMRSNCVMYVHTPIGSTHDILKDWSYFTTTKIPTETI